MESIEKPRGLAALETRSAAERGAELQLLDPAGEPTDMFITVIGADSQDYRRAERRAIDRATQEFMKGRRIGKTSEQVEKDAVELLAVTVRSWRTGDKPVFYDCDGNELAFSEANVRKVLADFPLVREQVQDFIKERANFLKR